MISRVLITALLLSKSTLSKPTTNAHVIKPTSQADSWKDFALSVLQLEPAREETDDTSGNTMDLSRVNSSPSLTRAINSSPNIGKTVDLPLTILGAPPRHQQHHQDIYEQEQLLNEFTSKFHMERSKAEEILDFLRREHQCGNGGGDVQEANIGNEASLTWLDVKPVNRQIASNLANFGNPFGGPNLQNRAGVKSKENNAKKNEDSIWFGK